MTVCECSHLHRPVEGVETLPWQIAGEQPDDHLSARRRVKGGYIHGGVRLISAWPTSCSMNVTDGMNGPRGSLEHLNAIT